MPVAYFPPRYALLHDHDVSFLKHPVRRCRRANEQEIVFQNVNTWRPAWTAVTLHNLTGWPLHFQWDKAKLDAVCGGRASLHVSPITGILPPRTDTLCRFLCCAAGDVQQFVGEVMVTTTRHDIEGEAEEGRAALFCASCQIALLAIAVLFTIALCAFVYHIESGFLLSPHHASCDGDL